MAPLALTRTYADARADFLDRSGTDGVVLSAFEHPQTGPDGSALACDVAWVGPSDATSVVVVVSGTHGVEGFAGSTLQRSWLRDLDPARPDDVAVCLVHALNPHGFAWVRRVNEDNVDLNRNFVDFASPPTNAGYDRIADLLVPPTWDESTQGQTSSAMVAMAGEVGFETFQQWVSGGQYRHPDGLFYGGTEAVWSNRTLRAVVDRFLVGRDRVAVIDLHTGLGPWGVGELISSDGPDDAAYRRAVDWFGDDVTSLTAGDSVSAELSGEWLPAVAAQLAETQPTETQVTAVALEFGTVDTLTVLQALRADAWLHAHGDPQGPEAAPIKAAVRAAFADDDPEWIRALWQRFAAVVDSAFRGVAR